MNKKRWPLCQTTAPEHVYLLLADDDSTDKDYASLADLNVDAQPYLGVMWSEARDVETVAQYIRTDIAHDRICEFEAERDAIKARIDNAPTAAVQEHVDPNTWVPYQRTRVQQLPLSYRGKRVALVVLDD